VDGLPLLRPDEQVFETMIKDWRNQGGTDTAVHGPQIGRPFVDVLRRPLPRHRIGMPGEGPDRAFLVIDIPLREIPGELLATTRAQYGSSATF
jgi:hypothetical protein